MAFAKRIILFLLVNLLVVLTISFTLSLVGVQGYLTGQGIDFVSLLVFAAIVGFSGALISLALSRVMAKWMMGVQVIDPAAASGRERDLVQVVHRLAQKAGLPALPEVGIYQSPEVNAFATGPSRSRALVAVSTGLLQTMDASALEGVLGHEISHVANGDMVTMTLLQGIVNTFVIFFARIAAWGLSQALAGSRDRDSGPSPMVHYLSVMVFEILFSFLGMIVVAAYSRRREYRADSGGARLAGREKMVHSLESLKRCFEPIDTSHPSVASLKIGGRTGGFFALLSTHPPLDERIAALRNG